MLIRNDKRQTFEAKLTQPERQLSYAKPRTSKPQQPPSWSNLTRANPNGQTPGARPTRAILERVNLSEANLNGADPTRQILKGANLKGNPYEANPQRGTPGRGNLSEASHLNKANPQTADLSKANL